LRLTATGAGTSSGFLVLEDQTIFEGQWTGNSNWTGVGEVVFNTSLVGYQEILTDPSYYQQIIVMTAPEQGNYGVIDSERESEKIWAQGFVCVEFNQSLGSNLPGRGELSDELAKFERPVLSDIDTRTLTIHLRSRGTPWGAMLCAQNRDEALMRANVLIKERKSSVSSDWVYDVSRSKTEMVQGKASRGRVAVLDYGAKDNIIRSLQKRFKEIAIFNSRASVTEILDWAPNGVMLTNGPGDPATVQNAVETVQALLGQVPVFGICMGHQILALALGGKTYKLKFGHRGGNHPVQDLASQTVYMTSQNHGYAVDKDLPLGVEVSQINLYDQTVEGIEAVAKKAWSVQYHPEASPGPHESGVLFDRFADRVI
jgi:carbamoyl-phosphate synthase small subunit